MKSPDLWKLIGSLSNKELARFRKFLHSPYFNKDDKHSQLFESVLEQVKEDRCDREALDAILFPYKPYEYTRITNLISDLKKLLEQFFVEEHLRSDGFFEEFFLLQEMAERKLDKAFGQSQNRLEKILSKSRIKGEEELLQQYLIEDISYEQSGDRTYLDKKIKGLHLFYIQSMLIAVCEDLSHRKLLIEASDKIPHKFFIQYILENEGLYRKDIILQLYISVLRIQLFTNQAEKVEAFQTEWLRYQETLPAKTRKKIFYLIHRQAQKHKKQGITDRLRYYTSFYKQVLKSTWIWEEEFLDLEAARDILFFLLEVDEREEVEYFLNTFRQKEIVYPLSSEFFNACYLSTLSERQREALKILDTDAFTTFEFGEEAYSLALKLSFYLYEDEILQHSLHRITQYLKKKTASSEEKEDWKLSKRFIGKLLKLRRQHKLSAPSLFSKRLEKLIREIQVSHEFPLKHWLMNCLEGLR